MTPISRPFALVMVFLFLSQGELQHAYQVEFTVKVFQDLVQIREHEVYPYRFSFKISQPDELLRGRQWFWPFSVWPLYRQAPGVQSSFLKEAHGLIEHGHEIIRVFFFFLPGEMTELVSRLPEDMVRNRPEPFSAMVLLCPGEPFHFVVYWKPYDSKRFRNKEDYTEHRRMDE